MSPEANKDQSRRSPWASLRRDAGLLALDWTRLEWHLFRDRCGARPGWTCIRNRPEALDIEPGQDGVICMWEWTRSLALCERFPAAANRLLRHALRRWPVAFANQPAGEGEEIVFLIGCRGLARLPQLLTTLRSLAGQRGACVRVLVVEQSPIPEVQPHLPAWIEYRHQPVPEGLPYCRSLLFNFGARVTDARRLIFHDGDMVVPADYTAEHVRLFREGFEAVQLKRFVFYLDEPSSARFEMWPHAAQPDSVIQNLRAGGSLGMTRNAFEAIGGFDEEFVGWGGEDDELWDRVKTLRVWERASLPVFHLFHESQPLKRDPANPTKTLLDRKLAIPPDERIRLLAPQGRKTNFSA